MIINYYYFLFLLKSGTVAVVFLCNLLGLHKKMGEVQNDQDGLECKKPQMLIANAAFWGNRDPVIAGYFLR